MKRFRVVMWEDMAERDPCEDLTVTASTHVQALRTACKLLRVHSMDFVRVEQEAGSVKSFIDVLFSVRRGVWYVSSY